MDYGGSRRCPGAIPRAGMGRAFGARRMVFVGVVAVLTPGGRAVPVSGDAPLAFEKRFVPGRVSPCTLVVLVDCTRVGCLRVDVRKTNGYGDTGQCQESPRWWPVLAPGKRMGITVHLGCVGRLHPFGMDCGIRGATPRNHTSPGRWPGTSNKIENRGLKARSIHAPKAMFVREMMGMEEMLTL